MEASSDDSNNELDLTGIKTKIQRINVEGLGRTKDDIVIDSVRDVFTADDFQSAIYHIHEARRKLQELGCFKNVGVLIDTYDRRDVLNDGIEVTFEVIESKLIGANVQTNIGNNEGSVSTGGIVRNVFGRGEELSSSYAYGSNKKSSYNSIFKKPLHTKNGATLSAEAYQDSTENPRCSYKETDRGLLFGLNFTSLPNVNHKLSLDNMWRHLSCFSLQTPFFVREQAGHSLKSSIINEATLDQRDQLIFPKDGIYAKLKNELAGITGGNIGFVKNEMEIEVNLPFLKDLTIQGSLQAGHLMNLRNNNAHRICDRFLLGGPSSIRGFEIAGVGPHERGCALGGELYWAAGLHMFSPLPLLAKGGLSDKFRLHGFVNIGNNGNFQLDGDVKKNLQILSNEMRLSYGAGVALNLAGMARLEFNYCIPLLLQRGDKPAQGLQFGIASNFL